MSGRTEAQMDPLQRISTGIEILESGYAVEWTPSRETESGVRTMPYPNYDRRLMEALWGASELVGTDYGYTERVDEVRELGVPGMTREQLSTFLTWVQRSERFCDGAIDGFVKNGRVLQALRRAAELGSNAEHGSDSASSGGRIAPSRAMRGWALTLKASAWIFAVGVLLVVVMALETILNLGWSTAGNWGYFLLAIFIGAGMTIVSALVALIAGIVLLVLRQKERG